MPREDFSHIEAPEGAAVIPLTQGQYAIVDSEDFDVLDTYNWYAQYSKNSDTFYALRSTWSKGANIREVESMHRFIMGVKDTDLIVDHINHNGLDNRRSNIRACTHTENLRNQKPNKKFSSQYVGVNFCKKSRKWLASINIDRKMVNLGYYLTEVEAAIVRDKFAKKHYGEFANLNIK